jgi:hypothetical protein
MSWPTVLVACNLNSDQSVRDALRPLAEMAAERDVGVVNREFKAVCAAAGIANGATLYTLRSSVTTSRSVGAKLAP